MNKKEILIITRKIRMISSWNWLKSLPYYSPYLLHHLLTFFLTKVLKLIRETKNESPWTFHALFGLANCQCLGFVTLPRNQPQGQARSEIHSFYPKLLGTHPAIATTGKGFEVCECFSSEFNLFVVVVETANLSHETDWPHSGVLAYCTKCVITHFEWQTRVVALLMFCY